MKRTINQGDYMTTEYIKVRFESKRYGVTAGLVLTLDKYENMSIEDLSRLYPYTEALKMQTLIRSKSYATWEEAFQHSFDTKGE